MVHEFHPENELMYAPQGTAVISNDLHHTQQQEALWRIAQNVAERDSIFFEQDATYHNWLCPFCNGGQTFHEHVRNEPFPHQPSCIVVKAREMIAWREAQPRIDVKIAKHTELEVPRD